MLRPLHEYDSSFFFEPNTHRANENYTRTHNKNVICWNNGRARALILRTINKDARFDKCATGFIMSGLRSLIKRIVEGGRKRKVGQQFFPGDISSRERLSRTVHKNANRVSLVFVGHPRDRYTYIFLRAAPRYHGIRRARYVCTQVRTSRGKITTGDSRLV